jgi:carbamoyltransferase
MSILGLNAFHGDASAVFLRKGQITAGVEEERFNRVKHWAGYPELAARACVNGDSVDHVAISRDPNAHLWRKMARVAVRPAYWPRAIGRLKNAASVARVSQNGAKVHHVEHHRAHLASAFFCSPFEEAAVISIDGFGDFSSVMWGVGRGNKIDVLGSVQFPHSLGLYYTAFTQFLGFPKYGDEYKLMGLSAYGEPRFARELRDVVRVEHDQVRLNLRYFTHDSEGFDMAWEGGEPLLSKVYSQRLVDTFGPPRVHQSEIQQRHCDLAASVQTVLEENYFALLNGVQRQTGQKKLCLAGGVALNCVANGKIFEHTDFQEFWVQPAAHDAGTSIGAALYVWHQVLEKPRNWVMRHVYYCPEYSAEHIQRAIDADGAVAQRLEEDELIDRTAQQIAAGKIVGWFQGRMEFGPRALGNRSILADPRRAEMKDTLNQRIKYRESFRPFCPSILAERAGEYFETDYPSPFMVVAYKIRAKKQEVIPAVTHGDGTGRLQTVERDVNPLYWKLIERFDQLTGVPVLLNTSFNENEPIVNTPQEALGCFLRTNMDVLVL